MVMPRDPFTLLTLRDLGEAQLLQRLGSHCQGIGDDGALLNLDPWAGELVVTTDVLVDGVHFSDRTTPAHASGYRAAAANLSDLAAMGSRPLGMVVGLGLPADTPVAWVDELYAGLTDCGDPWGCPIVGGDVCRSPHRFISITALGRVDPGRAIRRHTAQVGDALVVTGVHGSSRAGLALLQDPGLADLDLDPNLQSRWIRAHQYPQPRLDGIPYLASFSRVTGMDTSDGLADALVQICTLSGVDALVERIPMDPDLQVHFPDQAQRWALYGGEDFELLLSLPPHDAEQLVKSLPGAVMIGSILPPQGDPGQVQVVGWGSLDRAQGFSHFA